MAIFDINYNTKAIELLPPDKRNPILVGILQGLLSPLQFLRNKYLGDYRTGTHAPQWNPYFIVIGYPLNAVVIYKQVAYISLIDANHDIPPSANWQVYLPSFIGTNERVKFNGRKLVLEYALNEYFFTNFRQPPLVSDIYINKNLKQIVGFVIGQHEGTPADPYSSSIAKSDISGKNEWSSSVTYSINDIVQFNGVMYYSLANGNTDEPPTNKWHRTDAINYNLPFFIGNNFTIYIPIAVYSSIPNIQQECRNFVDPKIPAGIVYNIVSY